MAITLPDFTALPQVTPQAAGNLAQYPSTDAGAQGLATLGKGLEAAGGAATDIAAYQDIARTKADRAMAEADLLGRTIKLDAALKTETDPEKITALSNSYQEALDTSSQAIGNPEARSLWLAQNSHKVAQGQAQAYLRNTDVYRDNYLAGADAQFSSLTNIATSHEDPAKRVEAQQRLGELIAGMRDSGSISAAKAAEMTDKIAHGIVIGRSDYLDATGRSREALENIQRNGQYIPAATLDERSERYRKRDMVRGGQALADRVSGVPTAGGGPGATTAGEHYNFLISQGASPNEAALLTSAAGAESGFDPTKTHDGGIGYGLYGHNRERLTAMQQAAASQTPTWQQQAKFALDELRSRPEGAQVNAAKTPEQLTDLQFQFEQPKRGPGDQAAERLASTRQYMANPPKASTVEQLVPPAAPGDRITVPPAAQVAADVAAGGTAAAPTSTAGPGKFDLAGGSSIAVGLNVNNGLKGVSVGDVTKPEAAMADAAGSRNAQKGLDYIKTHPERFAGKNVLWTTGLENSGGTDNAHKQLPLVAAQLDALKAAGAANVVLAGVNQGKDASLNPELAKIAADKGVPFAGPLPSSDIHPSAQGYKNYHDHAAKLLPTGPGAAPAAGAGVPAAAATPTTGGSQVAARIGSTGGLVQPGTIDLSALPGGSTSLASAIPIDIDSGPLKGKQILLPTVAADGTALTRDQALDQYEKDGQHLGVFNNAAAATAYAKRFGRGPAVPQLPGTEGSGGGNGGDNAPTTAGTDEQAVESEGGRGAASPPAPPSAGTDQPQPAPATAAPVAAAPTVDIDTTYQQQLKAIEDDRTTDEEQKDVARRVVTARYNRVKAGASDALKKADAQITRLTQTAASHDDPSQRDAAAQNIDTIVNGLRNSGYITPEQADVLSDKATGAVIVARADYLDATGKSGEARQYLEEKSQLVPPHELDTRLHTFREREKVQGGQALADRLTTPPAAPELPPGTPAAVSQSQAARQTTINLESNYQQQLKDIEADPTSSQDQKDIASRIVTTRYQRAKAAISDQARKETATVNRLLKDDEASVLHTGTPIPELTPERVTNALGEEEGQRFAENRAQNIQWHENFHDMANLTQPEIDARLAQTKPKDGTIGFARSQQLWEVAQKNADALRKQRITDPAGSVATLPDVQEAAKTATLERPETFMPLVAARGMAMDKVGIPQENQVPITRAEAQELWKPIGLATETGNINAINAQLTDVIKRLQTATQDQSDKALQAVLREGHAGTETKGQAAALLKKLARGEAATQAETKAFDDAQKNDAAARAVAPVTPSVPGYPGVLPTVEQTAPQPTVAPAPPPVTFPAPTERAIETLRAKPESAAQFNEVFGPGSAEKVLQIVAGPKPPAPPPPRTLNQLIQQEAR